MAVCSEIHTKHINALCGQNVEFVNVKLVVYIVTTELGADKTVTNIGTHFQCRTLFSSKNFEIPIMKI